MMMMMMMKKVVSISANNRVKFQKNLGYACAA